MWKIELPVVGGNFKKSEILRMEGNQYINMKLIIAYSCMSSTENAKKQGSKLAKFDDAWYFL